VVEGNRNTAALRALTDGAPGRHDIFVGLVAPIGSSRDEVLADLSERLKQYGYDMERVRLADLLDDAPGRSGGDHLPRRGERGYHEQRMNAGDELRRMTGDDSALAALAIARVAKDRDARARRGDEGEDLAPKAYVFDSLKHPREARLLRNVYGPGFWLVSIVQEIEERQQNLADALAPQQGAFSGQNDPELDRLIRRDQGDPADKSGQHVRDVFADADYFLPVRRGVQWTEHIERFLAGVFDAPFITPGRHEEAMRHAKAASLRSAALGRQVGAVLVPAGGDPPYMLGTNEVPKPGGGQFREGDIPDYRDFQTGYDPNPTYVERLLGEVFERLARAQFFSDERNKLGGAAVLKEAKAERDGQPAVLDGIRAASLIEFTRCLHAEQAAIVSAARTGVAVAGSTLYTTTFPCHECTKIIVGAGIIEVQYIEPYPKSMASELYRDLIDAVPPMQSETTATGSGELGRVPFRPFLGFGPGRYDEVFEAGLRRDGTRPAGHNKLEACPIGRGWSAAAVKDKQDEVVVAFALASGQTLPAEGNKEKDSGQSESAGSSKTEDVG
jgi:cytidine deaminase